METGISNLLYCNSLTRYERMLTREVAIGNVPLGGNNPVRVQSMTTTDTMNTIATVEQSIRMIEAGCEYVRITAPSINEARNLENIKKELNKRGYAVPLIADIHFTPNAAEVAARIVEKVRVNPGNYADRKKFETIEYSDATYEAELERIRQRFIPLVKICKEYGTAMRIGTNHGSLSDRIMSRYGDTPLGMVESALEFLRICEEEKYFNIVLSMKASNPLVMVQAYRLLIVKMKEEGMNYPLHLGVTEAGEGEDGRIKSAVGIGSLLEDGIGDTIRVSLTEEPEFEIPVARTLVERYAKRKEHKKIYDLGFRIYDSGFSHYEYARRKTKEVVNIGGHNVPRVIADFSTEEKISTDTFLPAGYNYSKTLDKWNLGDQACDFIFLGNNKIDFEIPGTLGLIYNYATWKTLSNKTRCYPLFNAKEFFETSNTSNELNFVSVTINDLLSSNLSLKRIRPLADKPQTLNLQHVVFVFETNNEHGMAEQRRMFFYLMENDINIPVIIKRNYGSTALTTGSSTALTTGSSTTLTTLDESTFQLHASTDCGALFLDGFGDGIWLTAPLPTHGASWLKCPPDICPPRGEEALPPKKLPLINHLIINSTAFGILQATRTRISKTEYISCPSCGRTLFDLQETTAKIRSRTDHLKGIKIGIMGCIVNGPGEMADADYGYVGVGVGKITLYKGKEVVKRAIDSDKAVDALIDLIKQNGDWVEKER
ncbi:MAG TPA: (E)-4-hydroxy-3-methylbut-2-enyl-diphosphate synthase [Bacteroidia bacterium]|nr:(E)-4-hydroxy-3-methylbut-2-enyl-diphosphate synthase [Bacteroidia bacterium]